MNRLFAIGMLVSSLVVVGCTTTPGGSDDNKDIGIDVNDGEATPPLDHPPIDDTDLPVVSADTQRLSVNQLRKSFAVAVGLDETGAPIEWEIDTKGTKGFDEYAAALGEPDYLTSVQEGLAPSALYVKFVDDAARNVCLRAVASDYEKTDPAKRNIVRKSGLSDTSKTKKAAVDANLAYLKLRMHGMKVELDDEATLAPLRTVFDSTVTESAAGAAVTDDDVAAGWTAVCTALLVAPEFHLY
jgi:hypothetical protein